MTHKNIKLMTAIAAVGLAAAAAPVSAQMLEEVIVTAQKRVQGLGDVPVSMQAVSGDLLASQNISDFKGLVEQLPNVFLGTTPGPSTISIRGVGTGAANSAAEQSVGIYVDGLYVSRGHQFNSPFTDIERVEVLKGPQGVLQGKNSVAGALVITSRRPSPEFEASVKTSYEVENGGYNVEGMISGPITDNLSARFVAQQNLAGGFLDTNTRLGSDGINILQGEKDQNEDEFSLARLSLLWEPSDTVTIYTKAEIGEREVSGVSFGPSAIQPGATVPLNFDGGGLLIIDDFLNRDPNFDFIQNGVVSNGFSNSVNPATNLFEQTNADLGLEVDSASFTGQVDWDLDGGTLTAISGYSEFEHGQRLVNTMAPLDWLVSIGQQGNGGEDFDQFTQEIRFVSAGGETIDYIVGAFYMDRTIDRDASTGIFNLSTGGLAAPAFGDNINRRLFNENTKSLSVFGQVTWNISDSFRLNVGARYSDETKEVDVDFSADYLQDIPALNQIITDAFGVVFYDTSDLAVDKIEDTNFDPSASIQWDVNEDIMLYASATKATKAGGFNSSANRPDQASFDPEEATGYEIGLKGAFLDSRLFLNVALFQSTFDDLQVSALDNATSSFFFRNAAEATTEGLEADVRYAVSDSIEIGGAVAYTDATYDDFPGATCSNGTSQEADCIDNSRNAEGDKLTFAPEYSGSIYASYNSVFDNGMQLGLRTDVVFSDDYFLNGQNDPFQQQDSYTKVNLSASLTSADDRWTVSIIGKNLADETTSSFGGGTPQRDGAYWSNVDAPRLIYVSAEYRWF